MIKIQAESNVPTEYGTFRMIALSENENDWMPHMALIAEGTNLHEITNVRFHSECITGETFHSKKCECGQQLASAMQYMQEHKGMVIYLRQEGRNIGIINKLKAYALQEQGLDTVEANLHLGLPAEDRKYDEAIEILKVLGVKKINLLTNNPLKIKAVEESSIEMVSRIPLQIKSWKEDREYLQVKKDYFGHLLEDEE
ncbi:GTP cyclohydrolase II [Elizabethkingia sp. JS20170427COW]|uniref:GTP cyclohydrolase II n=1 Tax=Elizabethkingia sp. JS20170427COW TaxID=2583851 RepID=UPI0011105635|nr:GTP cyclohydrolase II [Elizabethkingia sp. JS20170427COW]QCX53600.1 GTP cyclohydrolase II [Elizabethkingia sp. JS20170427COW]